MGSMRKSVGGEAEGVGLEGFEGGDHGLWVLDHLGRSPAGMHYLIQQIVIPQDPPGSIEQDRF
jgi:hypothetical protein